MSETKRKAIVLIDDDHEMLEELEEMLEEEGCDVTAFHDASDISDVHWGDMSALVTDYFLPGGLSGIDVAKQAREENPGIGLVFLSGADIEGSIKESGLRNSHALGKPVDPDALINLIV